MSLKYDFQEKINELKSLINKEIENGEVKFQF